MVRYYDYRYAMFSGSELNEPGELLFYCCKGRLVLTSWKSQKCVTRQAVVVGRGIACDK